MTKDERIRELENRLQRIYNLFADGPDTRCRTVWRHGESIDGIEEDAIECVEVSTQDLRDALDG